MTTPIRPLLCLLILLGGLSCASSKPERHSRAALEKRLAEKRVAPGADQPGLVIGDYRLRTVHPVLDGDTIVVDGLDASLRLLGLDAEETFKKEYERRDYADGWEQYVRKARGTSTRPVKFATPLGEEGRKFAERFFEGVTVVRLERDHPGEIRDFYGRYLAYVFAEKDGQWVNYNVECVRAGFSPYFEKYGRSRRFHEAFVQAQAEARAARRGIWSEGGHHYGDYDERLAWWGARGAAIDAFEKAHEGRQDVVVLTRVGSMRALERLAFREVTVFGSVGDIRKPASGRGPTQVHLARTRISTFPLVFFDEAVLEQTGLQRAKGEYVAARGKVELYKGKPQMIVKHADQITVFGRRAPAPEEAQPEQEEAPAEGEKVPDAKRLEAAEAAVQE